MNHLPTYRRRPLMFCQQLLAVISTYTSRRTLLLVVPAFLFMMFPAFQVGRQLTIREPRTPAQPTVVLPNQWMVDGEGFQPFDQATARLPAKARLLTLTGRAVTDEAVIDLLATGDDSLFKLDLTDTAISSRTLKRIARLTSLISLRLEWTSVTTADLQMLAAKDQLRALALRGVRLDQQGLSAIAKMARLSSLVLEDLQVESRLDLSVLKQLKSLTSLRIKNVTVVNESAQSLSRMTQLEYLSLRDTGISLAAIEQLRVQLPETEISHSQKKPPGTRAMEKRLTSGGGPLLMLFCPLFMLVPTLAMHVRTQVVDPRSRIIPGFPAPHLTVAALILLAFSCSLSLIATFDSDGSFFGMLSLVTTATILLFATGYFQSTLLTFSVIGGIMWLSFGAPETAVQWIVLKFFQETASRPAVVLLSGSLVAFGCLLRRMSRIHEDMPEYGVTADMETFWSQRSTSAKRQQQRVQAMWVSRSTIGVFLCDSVSGWLMRHLPQQPLPRRLMQFQVAHGMAFVTLPIMLIVMFFMMQMFSGIGTGQMGGRVAVIGLIMMLPIMGVSMILGAWMQHWNWFASELMFPLDRRTFVKSLLSGILLDGLVVLVIAEAFIAFQMAQGLDSGNVPMPDFWLAAAVLCGANIMSGSAMLSFVLSYRSFWWLLAGIFGQTALFGGTTAIVMESLENGFSAPPILLPVAFAGCGLMVMWLTLAWRHWNSLEFG